MDKIFGSIGCLVLSLLLPLSAFAQTTGRPQDGFYSGQSNGQVSGQSRGQVSGRIDGRANKNEGVPPAVGDVSKRSPPIEKNNRLPNDAESMDTIARPGLQR